MGSPQPQVVQKPHAVCLPFPVQGHIKPMLDLAKLLHSRGFYITFINTEFNQRRLIKSGALNPTVQIDGFRFETIPDGLDTPEMDATQNVRDLAYATSKRCLGPLKQLIERLNGDSECGPYISFMIRDASMRFAQRLDLGMVDVTLWTMSACSYMGFLHYEELGSRGYTPFKGAISISASLSILLCRSYIIVGHVLMVQESLYSLSTRSSQLDWKATESIATFPKEAQFVGR
ncbi:hypothetical protein AAC387_Pa11g1311 [Persea americana]